MPDTPPQLAHFVIVGFAKCGTSALARALGALDEVDIDRMDGNIEAPFFNSDANVDRLRQLRATQAPARVVGHKCTAYVFAPSTLRRIVDTVPQALLIVCVRDPLRALMSWREMHRKIADRGTPAEHFVNESDEARRFYTTASLEDYYHRYARTRLTYASHVRRIMRLAPAHRVALVAQETLSRQQPQTLATLAGLLGVAAPVAADDAGAPHKAYADRAVPEGLSEGTRAELDRERGLLAELVAEMRQDPRCTVLAPVETTSRA